MELETVHYKRIPSRSKEASLLIELMKGKPEGHEFTYAELTKQAGIPIDPTLPGWAKLASARRFLERTEQAVWEPIRGEKKLRRLDSTGRNTTVTTGIQSTRRKVRRLVIRSATVEPSKLAEGERTTYLINSAQLGAMAMVSSSQSRKAIEATKAFDEAAALKAMTAK